MLIAYYFFISVARKKKENSSQKVLYKNNFLNKYFEKMPNAVFSYFFISFFAVSQLHFVQVPSAV